MSEIIDNLYFKMVVELKALPKDLQERIYKHASKNKNNKLLARLVERDDLDPNLDKELGANKNIAVRSAWLVKPKRSKAELNEVLKNEKRIKVIRTALASGKLPKSLYESLLDRCGYDEALAIAGDESCNDELRMKAMERAFECVSSPTTDYGFCAESINRLERVFSIDTELARRFLENRFNNENLVVLGYAGGEMSLDEQDSVVKVFISKIDKNKIKQEGDDIVHHLDVLVKLLQNMDEHSSFALNTLREIAKKINKEHKKSWIANRAERLISVLDEIEKHRGSNKKPSQRLSFDGAETRAELETILEKVDNQYDSHSWVYSRSYWGGLTRQLLLSKLSNVDDIVKAEDWIDFEASRVDYSEIESTKIGALAMLSWEPIDSNLQKAREPKVALRSLIELCKSNNTYYKNLEQILVSKYFDDDLLDLIPATELLNLSDSKLEFIADLLSERLKSEESWHNFETIVDDFTGSFSELLEISNKL